MNKHQQHLLLSFRRVIGFIEARPSLTPDTAEGRAFLARVQALRVVADRIEWAAAEQHTARAAGTYAATGEPELRRQLCQVHMASIARVAQSLRASVPGIGVLRLPRKNLRSMSLIERAEAFARQAQIYAVVLTEHGLPADVIAQLNSAIVAFRASVDSRGTARGALGTATGSIESDVAVGRLIVKGMDGIIVRLLDANAGDLEAWRRSKRTPARSANGEGASFSGESPSSPGERAPTVGESAATEDKRAA